MYRMLMLVSTQGYHPKGSMAYAQLMKYAGITRQQHDLVHMRIMLCSGDDALTGSEENKSDELLWLH